jgi:phage/plasmid-like protein (TIGR03299 family)
MTSSDGFFAVRQAAWHGLGTVFEDYPKRVEAQQLAHPWEPMAVPVYTRRVVVERDEITGQEVEREVFEEIKGHVANIRDDNRAELGVVPVTYNLVQNSQLWDVAEALENSGPDVMFETGGSYGGGKGVWVLIRLKEPLIVRGDPRGETIPYYALQNSHDGTGAFRGQATMTRIVCANTSRIADVEAKARGTEFAAYGLVQASIEYQEWYRRANNSESRFKRSFLSRNTIVSDAVALALTASSESVGQ